MRSDFDNFNYGRPRCAESLPRVPPYSSMHDVLSIPVSAYSGGRKYVRDIGQPLNCANLASATAPHSSAPAAASSTPGTYFGVVGRSQTSSNFFGSKSAAALSVMNAATTTAALKSQTLGNYGRNATMATQRSSMGHLLEKSQGNAFDDFFVPSSRAPSKSTQYIVGRQTSSRPNHVCYSLQCPCQPTAANPALATRAPSVPLETVPLSAYYPSPDLEKYRRPVESPKLSESQNSLTNASQDNANRIGTQSGHQTFLNYLPPPAYHATQPSSGGVSSIHYFDLSETSSEASTRIASRMSSDHNVTQSTENDTHHLTKAPYTITKGMMPVKKDSLYPSSGKSVEPVTRLTPFRMVLYACALIFLFTVLCLILLVVSQSIPLRWQEPGLRSASEFSPFLEEGSLSVVPAPTDLMDRSQVIIVNRHNPSTYEQQAQQLSDLLTVVSAYNATQTDAAFPTQLVSEECSAADNFGYRSGDPCVAVVFRPNPNFIPVATKEGILELECLCENRHVRIGYSPFRGFPLRFFPRGRNASPLLAMLKFTDLPFKTELRISCGLSGATNVDRRKDRVSFQIMVI